MCVIWVGKIVCCILFVLTGILILASTFSPWRTVYDADQNLVFDEDHKREDYVIGSFSLFGTVSVLEEQHNQESFKKMFFNAKYGGKDLETETVKTMPDGVRFCKDNLVFTFYVVAFVIYVFNLVWTAVSFCICCCDKCFMKVLPLTTFLATVLLIAGIIIFSFNYNVMYSNGEHDTKVWNFGHRSPCSGDGGSVIHAGAEDKGTAEASTVADTSTTMSEYETSTTQMTSTATEASVHHLIAKRSACPDTMKDPDAYDVLQCDALTQKTEYNAGLYLGIVAILVSLVSFILSLFVSFLSKYFC